MNLAEFIIGIEAFNANVDIALLRRAYEFSDRAHQGHRRDHASSTHTGDDPVDPRDLPAGRKLEREGPSGMVGSRTQLLPRCKVIQLDDDAIDLVADIVPVIHQLAVVLEHLVKRLQAAWQIVDPQTPLTQSLQNLPLRGERHTVDGQDVVDIDI